MHNEKNSIFILQNDLKSENETIPQIRMFQNQIHMVKMKIEIAKVS